MAAKKRRLTKQLEFAPQVFHLAKGLTQDEAFRAMKQRAKRDFRGFNYNPNTGRGELI
jgi:hypothetical protein